jgi:RND family efflux transporter MFP subunit
MQSEFHKTVHGNWRPARTLRALPYALGLMLVLLAGAGTAVAQQNSPAPKVSVAAAFTREVTDEDVFIGRGEAIDKVSIVARINGFLQEVAVKNGAVVKAGDLLFRIESDLYEATLQARQADAARAEANLELANLDLGRKEELLRREAVSVSERDIARAKKLVAEADVRAAAAAIRQAELDLSYSEIRAPFAGRIGRIAISTGDVVGPSNPPLVTLVRESPIYVSFSLNEKQLADIMQQIQSKGGSIDDPAKSANVLLELPNQTELDETGKIVFIDNRINPTTGSITVRAEFDNNRRMILDGAFLNVRIQAREPQERLLIPMAAIQRDQRGDFVLVVTEKKTVEQRYVRTGGQLETAIIVLEGMREGETVIVEGLQRVRPGVAVDPVLAAAPGQ